MTPEGAEVPLTYAFSGNWGADRNVVSHFYRNGIYFRTPAGTLAPGPESLARYRVELFEGACGMRHVGHSIPERSHRSSPSPLSTLSYHEVCVPRETIGEDLRHHGLPSGPLFGADGVGVCQRKRLP